MNDGLGKQKAREYYDQESADYINQYQSSHDEYPANLIRIKFVIDRLKKNKVKTILDVGSGSCGPIIKLLQNGFKVKGFDFSEKMVKEGQRELKNAGYDPKLIYYADLENENDLPEEKFDAVIALGVFPHILNEKKALSNMRKMLNPGGLVFIEFRNDLFASYTLNKYSLEFFVNRVIDLNSLPSGLQSEVVEFYSDKLKVDKPTKAVDGKIAYTDILAKYRNPLTISEELFTPSQLSVVKTHFYHYHALPPVFENKHPKLFRELSLKLENPGDWRGNLMASAFVIEAKRLD